MYATHSLVIYILLRSLFYPHIFLFSFSLADCVPVFYSRLLV